MARGMNMPDGPRLGKNAITIDGMDYQSDAAKLNRREVLDLASKHPTSDYMVYVIDPDRNLREVQDEPPVDLRYEGKEAFFTFRSDRSYRFEFNGRRQDWGSASISELVLQQLVTDAGHSIIILDGPNQQEHVLSPGEMVDLSGQGTERIRSEKRFTITVVNEDNGEEFQLQAIAKTTMLQLIDEMYQRLHLERKPGDRLRCEQDGKDVFQYTGSLFGEYLSCSNCTKLVWLFAGETGGA